MYLYRLRSIIVNIINISQLHQYLIDEFQKNKIQISRKQNKTGAYKTFREIYNQNKLYPFQQQGKSVSKFGFRFSIQNYEKKTRVVMVCYNMYIVYYHIKDNKGILI